MAFNAKNLTYDKSEPAFLQRIRAGYASQDGRSNIQHARPGKSRLRMGDGDEDDGPVILDESGEVVHKDVYEGMLKGKVDDGEEEATKDKSVAEQASGNDRGSDKEQESERDKQKISEIGVMKKRKAVKVVGDDEGDEKDKRQKELEAKNVELKTKIGEKSSDGIAKPKKKAKKIKLSFDDPE